MLQRQVPTIRTFLDMEGFILVVIPASGVYVQLVGETFLEEEGADLQDLARMKECGVSILAKARSSTKVRTPPFEDPMQDTL